MCTPHLRARGLSRRQFLALSGSAIATASLPLGSTLARASAAAAQASSDQAITLTITDNLLNMDPALLTTGSDYAVALLVYSSLVRRNFESGKLEGDLAKSWNVSEDGLVYTFNLRDNVKWQKGYGTLTADDVVYSFERIRDPKTGSRYLADIEPVTRIEAVNPTTVRFTMKTPYPGFLDAVVAYRPGFIVNKQAIEKLGKGYVNGPVGTGPYVFDRWTPSASVELSANKDYFGGPLAIQKTTFRIIPKDTVAEIALTNGEIDAGYFQDPEVQERITKNKDLQVITRPMPRSYFVYLNMQRDPFKDVRVRQAIAHAIDRQSIVDYIFLGQAKVADSPLNPNVFGYLDVPGLDYNVDKAKKLLADAGHPKGFPDQTFEFVLTSGSSYPETAQAMQPMLEEIGIKVKISVLERALYEQRRQKNDYDLLGQTTLRVEPSQILVPYFDSAQAPYPDINGYSGADDLIDKARFEPNEDKRRQYYYEAQRKIMQDMPVVPLLYPVQVLAGRKGLSGLAVGELTYPVWQMSVSKAS